MERFSGLILMLLLGMSAHAPASTSNDPVMGLPLQTLDGKTLTLNQFSGKKPVYLKFWASWCQPCRKQMPHLQHTFEQYGDAVEVIAVNLGVNESLTQIEATQKEFGLSVPIVVDDSGKLAQAFKLMGTPYHILLDEHGEMVHQGHEASAELDNKIALLASRQAGELPKITLQTATGKGLDLKQELQHPTALFFVATWCDWYLKDSRPTMSQSCVKAQNLSNKLHREYPDLNWIGIATRLWTGPEELKAYKEKYAITHQLVIDHTNDAFFGYGVKDIPTLILVNKGKEVARLSDFDNPEAVKAQIDKAFGKL